MIELLVLLYVICGCFYAGARVRAGMLITGQVSVTTFLIHLALWPLEAHAMLSSLLATTLALRIASKQKGK